MPSPESETALVPAASGYSISIKDVAPGGQVETYLVPIADSVEWKNWTLMLRAAVLKKGNSVWRDKPIPEILHAIVYAESLGLDIVQGDVYVAEGGRLAVTNDARIKSALGSGRIAGYRYEVSEIPAEEDKADPKWRDWETKNASGTYEGPNLRSKVTVGVKGWTEQVVYETTLDQWFLGRNANWRTRTPYMFRKSSIAHALNEVCPIGLDEAEVPPLVSEVPDLRAGMQEALKKEVDGG